PLLPHLSPGRRPRELRGGRRGDLPAGCRLRRPDPQGGQTGRPSRPAADDVRAGDQPQGRPGPRPADPALRAGPGGRGGRVVPRRAFTGGTRALLAAPLAVEAQQVGKVYRIGFLAPGPAPANVAALREGLRELGYVEPSNLVLEPRWGDGRLDRLPGLAADLLRFGIDVIVTDSTAAALAAKDATTTIPIVMGTGSSDPVGRGLVASIAHPGGNVTGLTLPTLTGKRFEMLKEAVPGLIRLAYIWNPTNPAAQSDLRDAEAAARRLGLQLHPVGVKGDDDLNAAFARASK